MNWIENKRPYEDFKVEFLFSLVSSIHMEMPLKTLVMNILAGSEN